MKISASKLGLLSTLYFIQGMPYGFQTGALAAYARAQGMSLSTIGFLSVLSLPWLLKPLWAPLVERYGSARLGERKSWILPMQAGIALSCLAASLLPPGGSILPLMALVFLMNLFAATQDIAVDGLAVDLLHAEDLGLGNTVQVVGYKLGILTTGGLLVWASEVIGWRGIFLAMAALAVAGLGVTLAAHEPPRAERGGSVRMEWREIFERMKAAVLLPGAGWLLLFIGTYKLGESLSDALYKAFLVDSGFTLAQIGKWSGTWGTVASLTGSVAGGLLASQLPLPRAVFITALLRVIPLLGRWALAIGTPSMESIIGVTLAEEFFGGALTTAMFAFMMSRVDRRIGAAHYTLLAGVELLGKMPAGPAAGLLADVAGWSYAQVFLLGVGLSVAFLVLLVPLRKQGMGKTPPMR